MAFSENPLVDMALDPLRITVKEEDWVPTKVEPYSTYPSISESLQHVKTEEKDPLALLPEVKQEYISTIPVPIAENYHFAVNSQEVKEETTTVTSQVVIEESPTRASEPREISTSSGHAVPSCQQQTFGNLPDASFQCHFQRQDTLGQWYDHEQHQINDENLEDGVVRTANTTAYTTVNVTAVNSNDRNSNGSQFLDKYPSYVGDDVRRSYAVNRPDKTYVNPEQFNHYGGSYGTNQTTNKHLTCFQELFQMHVPNRSMENHACTICNQTFATLIEVDSHIRNVHALIPSTDYNRVYQIKNINVSTYTQASRVTHWRQFVNVPGNDAYCENPVTDLHASKNLVPQKENYGEHTHNTIVNNHRNNPNVRQAIDENVSATNNATSVVLDADMTPVRKLEKYESACGQCYCFDEDREAIDSYWERKAAHVYKCKICSSVLKRAKCIRDHVRGHWNIRSFGCKLCSKTFTNKEAVLKHNRTHDPEFECRNCGKKFVKFQAYKDHTNVHRGIKPYKCKKCSAAFSAKDSLWKHVKATHKKKNVPEASVCDICGKLCISRSRFLIHKEEMHGGKVHKCTVCDKTWRSRRSLRNHMHVHKKECLTCDVCSKSFICRSKILRHIKLVHAVGKYECTECGKRYKAMKFLKDHILSHQGIKKYCCPICGKTFASANNLDTHKFVHREKNFVCHVCDAKFNRNDNLKSHVKRMHGEKKSTQDLPANKKSIVKKNARKVFTCTVCEKTFNTVTKLKEHSLTHDKRYCTCDYCSKSYVSKIMLCNHIMKVHLNSKN